MVKEITLRYLRLSVYLFTLFIDVVTFFPTLVRANKITGDAEFDFYYPFWPLLFTFWACLMKTIHAAIGIYCDLNPPETVNGNSRNVEKLRRFKSTFFSCYVWPSCHACGIIYWFFYHYDRTLVNERLMKKIMSPFVNQTAHTLPVFTVILEALLNPRVEPASHKTNMLLVLSTPTVYLLVLAVTYTKTGTWIYPFYQQSYGTAYFPLIQVVTFALTAAVYYAQWPISRIITKQDLKDS